MVFCTRGTFQAFRGRSTNIAWADLTQRNLFSAEAEEKHNGGAAASPTGGWLLEPLKRVSPFIERFMAELGSLAASSQELRSISGRLVGSIRWAF